MVCSELTQVVTYSELTQLVVAHTSNFSDMRQVVCTELTHSVVASSLQVGSSASRRAFPAGRSSQEPLLSDHNQTKQQAHGRRRRKRRRRRNMRMKRCMKRRNRRRRKKRNRRNARWKRRRRSSKRRKRRRKLCQQYRR